MEQAYQKSQTNRKPSFSVLVKERFSDDLIRAVLKYAKTEQPPLLDPVIEKVIPERFTEKDLFFTAVTRCVRVTQDRSVPERMLLFCACPLEDAFLSVRVLDILPYSASLMPASALPDDLIPVLSKAELDLTAARILKQIYPRAEHHAEAVCPDSAAQRLGLSIVYRRPDPDSDLLGRVFFSDDIVRVRRLSDGEPELLAVQSGTVLIHTLHNGFIDRHLINSTILHECVHWILHRPAFLLRKAFDNRFSSVAHRKRPSFEAPSLWTPAERMEWQARALSSRLLMPAWSTKFVAESWLNRYARLAPVLRMERVIDKLSQRFSVSRQLARIRMIELGYPDAEHAFSFYDRKNCRLAFSDAVRAFSNNPALQSTLLSGCYAYVDGFFVLLDRKNVFRDESGSLRLTPYAKSNPEAVCLSFAARRVPKGSFSELFRYRAEDETFLTGSAVPLDVQAKKTRAVMDILQKLPSTFSETLAEHMKRKCISNELLAERCLMSDRQIYRFKSTPYPAISLRNAVGLCIGLRLHPMLSMDLIQKAGYRFNPSLEHTAYQVLLLSMSECSIYDCNTYLKSLGLKPIGKEE